MILIKLVLKMTFSSNTHQYVLGIWASTNSTTGTTKEGHGDIKPSSLQRVRILNYSTSASTVTSQFIEHG